MNIWTLLSASTAGGVLFLEFGLDDYKVAPGSSKFLFFLFLGFSILAVLHYVIRGAGERGSFLTNSEENEK